jgi:hypothetical protein
LCASSPPVRAPWAAHDLAAALDDPASDVRRQVVRGLEEVADAGLPAPIARNPASSVAARELGSDDNVLGLGHG